jgi:hypothetical protein
VIQTNFGDLIVLFWCRNLLDHRSSTFGCMWAALLVLAKASWEQLSVVGRPSAGGNHGSALTTNAVQPPGHALVTDARSRCIERPVGLPGLAVTASPRLQVNDGRSARKFAEIVVGLPVNGMAK